MTEWIMQSIRWIMVSGGCMMTRDWQRLTYWSWCVSSWYACEIKGIYSPGMSSQWRAPRQAAVHKFIVYPTDSRFRPLKFRPRRIYVDKPISLSRCFGVTDIVAIWSIFGLSEWTPASTYLRRNTFTHRELCLSVSHLSINVELSWFQKRRKRCRGRV